MNFKVQKTESKIIETHHPGSLSLWVDDGYVGKEEAFYYVAGSKSVSIHLRSGYVSKEALIKFAKELEKM